MRKFNTYSLWYYPILATPSLHGIDTPVKTSVTFKAVTEAEAMYKAHQFWLKGKFGMGKIFVQKELT